MPAPIRAEQVNDVHVRMPAGHRRVQILGGKPPDELLVNGSSVIHLPCSLLDLSQSPTSCVTFSHRGHRKLFAVSPAARPRSRLAQRGIGRSGSVWFVRGFDLGDCVLLGDDFYVSDKRLETVGREYDSEAVLPQAEPLHGLLIVGACPVDDETATLAVPPGERCVVGAPDAMTVTCWPIG